MSDALARPLSELREEYWMIQKLGCGGFGKVYLIKHRKSKEYFAAKHQKWPTSEAPIQHRKEVSILKKVTSTQPNHVVRFVDYFEGERQSVILMEFLGGGELFQHIASSTYHLTESKCREFARQILQGIQFIHSHSIIHLDLKPQNIVLVNAAPRPSSNDYASSEEQFASARHRPSSEGSGLTQETIKIIDFGLARDMRGFDSIPITMCGTLEFMSPEVLKCTQASFASDLWSIGVILYMMVSGGLSPFWASTQYRTQRCILRGQLTNDGFAHHNFSRVSKSAKDCISNLLRISPAERLTANECLQHRWLTTAYLDTIKNLETVLIRKYLARRRWQRWFNAIRAMNRMLRIPGILDNGEGVCDDGNVASEDKSVDHAFVSDSGQGARAMGLPRYNPIVKATERWV